MRLWFWDDYVSALNSHSDLERWYYSEVMNLRSARDQDRLILEMVATAFHPSAFTDPLNIEQVDDLVQGLRNSQAALRTGKLVDRRTGHILRQAVGGWRSLDDDTWRARAKELDGRLEEVRRNLLAGLADGRLERRGGLLFVRDAALGIRRLMITSCTRPTIITFNACGIGADDSCQQPGEPLFHLRPARDIAHLDTMTLAADQASIP